VVDRENAPHRRAGCQRRLTEALLPWGFAAASEFALRAHRRAHHGVHRDVLRSSTPSRQTATDIFASESALIWHRQDECNREARDAILSRRSAGDNVFASARGATSPRRGPSPPTRECRVTHLPSA
jgi:hypothetical protein